MRMFALVLAVPPLIAALLVSALIATARPAPASQPQADRDRATLIETCMREMRSGLKAGQQFTAGQRLMAEEQCRARVEASRAEARK
jgi:hypothetical protein